MSASGKALVEFTKCPRCGHGDPAEMRVGICTADVICRCGNPTLDPDKTGHDDICGCGDLFHATELARKPQIPVPVPPTEQHR